MAQSAMVIDCRKPHEFAENHVPNSIFIGLDGGFAPWAGAVIEDLNQKVLIVVEPGRESEAVTRLSRVGIDNTMGFLDGGIEAWKNAGLKTEKIRSISAQQFEAEINDGSNIIDVRNNGEYANGHLVKSTFRPLDNFHQNIEDYNIGTEYYIHCQGGYRSMIACSLLKAQGIKDVIDIKEDLSPLPSQLH